ncbi:MAG: hypothetical protein FWE03_04245 [Firmicutes bacterium]|nr:hypothetical protein [Bacillota bacterium]
MARKKIYDDDDGRTIVNMNVEGMKDYIAPEKKKEREEIRKLNLTKKERRALFWGAYKVVAQVVLIMAIGFGLAFLLIHLWLR